MANINWDKPFYFSLSTGETVPECTPGSIKSPTYGLYGGGGYTAGGFPGDIIGQPNGMPYSFEELTFIGTDLQDPADALDYLSYRHDWFSSLALNDAEQAQADATFLGSVVALDSRNDPEMALYAGATTIGMIGSLALHGFLGMLSPFQLVAALKDAVLDIDYGLDNLPETELIEALNFFFEPGDDPGVIVFDFVIKTTSFRQELVEAIAMNALDGFLDGGEADNLPINTGFPFPGTSPYWLGYNAITGDLDLLAA